MKKITIAIMSLLAFVLASCNSNISPETANAFKGEYWMKTTTYMKYQGNIVQEPIGPTWSPVTIYEENGKLYVRTDYFGAPDTDISEGAKHEYIGKYDDHPNYAPAIYQSVDSIGNVEDDGTIRVVLMSGRIWSIRYGAYLRSLPIQVKSGSETILNLCDFKPVDVTITDAAGIYLDVVKVRYEYGPMVKVGDSITWEVVFPFDFNRPNHGDPVDQAVHKNILYKK